MAENTQPAAAPAVANAAPNADQSTASGMRGEIGGKWPKLSAQDIAALTSKEDLINEVQSKYALDRAQARRDVDTFAKGRQL